MKFRKSILIVIAALLVLTGCSQKSSKKAAQLNLTASQVVKKAPTNLGPGLITHRIKLASPDGTQLLLASANFGGKPAVAHSSAGFKNASQNQGVEMWLGNDTAYLHGKASWYTIAPGKVIATPLASYFTAMRSNDIAKGLTAAQIKKAQVKNTAKTATISYQATDPALARSAFEGAIASYPLADNQQKYFNMFLPRAKYDRGTVREEINKQSGRVLHLTIKVHASVDNKLQMNLTQTYKGKPQQKMLTIPQEVTSTAKPMPKNPQDRK